MSKWPEELPPDPEVPRRRLVEWLIRSFQSLSRWSERNHDRGYGGIYLSQPYDIPDTPLPVTPPLALGPNSYDSVLTQEPIGVGQDLTNGYLIPKQAGIWLLTIGVTAEITPVSANAANTIALSIYDVTAAQLGDQPIYFTVPRYGESFTILGSIPLQVTEDIINHEFQLVIYVLSPTPTITLETVISTDFHLTRLG